MHSALAAALAILVGCSSTNVVNGGTMALRKGGHRDAFNAGDVRISPNSRLRFCRNQVGCGDWIEASDLRVDDTGPWVDGSAGYKWSDIEYVEVKGFDGIKTTGAILGVTAAIAIIIPIIVAAAYVKALPKDGPPAESSSDFSDSSAGKAVAVAGVIAEAAIESEIDDAPVAPASGGGFYWGAALRGGSATSAHATRLFSTGARVRSMITLGAHVDSGVAYAKNLVTNGAVGRLRLGDFLELGAGVRLAHTKGMDGVWEKAPLYVVQGGFHSPITARFALPLGVDVAWGKGALAREIKIPWGFRYTSPSGRWTGTLQPITPSYAKRADADKGRWTITVGLELGVTL